MLTTVETFEHIIRHQDTARLLPFLLHLEKSDIVAIRQKTKALRRELNEFKDLGNGRWGSASTPEQNRMLFLAGLKTYSRKEALGSDFGIWQLEPQHRPAFWCVLENARPAWLLDWLLRWVDTITWQLPDYQLLRELESRQLIAFHPRLFALSLVGLLAETGNRLSQTTPIPTDALAAIADEFRRDTTLLTRDLPLLFDFDSGVANTQARVQLPMSANHNWHVSPLTWQTWHEAHPAQLVTWTDLLRHLSATGDLDRTDLLTRCLLALRRDFRRPLLIWFKDLFLSLQPTLAERLARQNDLVELLAHPLPLVVNFALEQLKNVWTEPGFNLAPLLLYADNLLTRPDLKTGLKTLLGGLGKLPKHDATYAPAVAHLLAAALAHADSQVQERAAKHLAELLKAKKTLLSATELAETVAAIGYQADLLGAAARALLKPWLPEVMALAGAAIYAPIQQFSPELSPATAIVPVADWHELLFLTGQVLRHDAPAALERWLDGLLRLRAQWPADYSHQLQPFMAQHFPWLVKNKTEAEALHELAQHRFSPEGSSHRELVHALLISWVTGFRRPKVRQIAFSDYQYHHNADPLLLAERQRLAEVEAQLSGPAAPIGLLSTPSHAPHWVSPSALVQRLLACEAAGHAPNPADLALALARTAWAAEPAAAPARALLARLAHSGLRELLGWFLAPAAAPDAPLPAAASSSPHPAGLLHKLLFFKASPPDPLTAALPWLWAVAARTRRPDAVFEELRPLAHYPGLAEAWQPGWHIAPQRQTYHPSWQPQPTTHTWQELHVPTEHPGQEPPSPLLLYSQHARLWQENRYYLWPLQADLPFLLALLPGNPAPLHWHVLRTACRTTDQHAEGSEVVQQVLRSLLAPGPAFGAPTTALLAVGLTHQASACRFLALEVLLAAVATGRLVPAALGHDLGRLLAASFVPLARLADVLTQAQAASPATDDALGQLLDALLPTLPTTPLRNLRKLLDLYTDLGARTGRPVPAAVQAQLHTWQATPALKKASALLLA